MRVDEWMRRDVPVIEPDTSLAEAEEILERHGLRQLPIVAGSRLVGLVDDTAVAAAHPSPATTLTVREIAAHLATIPVSRLMRRDPPAVAPSTPLGEAVRLMLERDLAVLPVEQHGRLVGALVDTDLLALLERVAAPRFVEEVARAA